jgi:chromosome segregation ATPase
MTPDPDALLLALENRRVALSRLQAELQEVDTLRAELAEATSRAAHVEELMQVLARQLEDVAHHRRVAEHELGVARHEWATTKWELESELHQVRAELARANERAVQAEQHPLRHLVTRLRARFAPRLNDPGV